jgi:hypothetical protein
MIRITRDDVHFYSLFCQSSVNLIDIPFNASLVGIAIGAKYRYSHGSLTHDPGQSYPFMVNLLILRGDNIMMKLPNHGVPGRLAKTTARCRIRNQMMRKFSIVFFGSSDRSN